MNPVTRPALLVLLLVAGTTGSSPAATTSTASLAASYGAFGFNLLARERATQQNSNVVISPASVAIALAMAANGAQGRTRDEILRALHLSGIGVDDLNQANEATIASLKGEADVRFSLANAVWTINRFSIKPGFSKTMASSYQANAQHISAGAAGADAVNTWVRKNTFGMILKIINRVRPLDRAILTNALALDAKWQQPFKAAATSRAPFHIDTATSMQVQMMHLRESLSYAESDAWQCVRLPYGTGRYAMYIFLPVGTVKQPFVAKVFQWGLSALAPAPVDLSLPRTSIALASVLNDSLQALGIRAAFDPMKANFRDLSDQPGLFISRVNHAIYVHVDEAGAKAAAATAIVISLRAMRVNPAKKVMTADHPFDFVIRDDQSGQFLLIGHVSRP